MLRFNFHQIFYLLRYLSIIRGGITELYLASFLQDTPKLSNLQYHVNIEANPHHTFSAPRLLQGLQSVSSTLRTPRISLAFQYNSRVPRNDGITWDLHSALGSSIFRTSFPCLVNLEAPMALLLGWEVNSSLEIIDVLPPSVQTMVIRDDLAGFADYLWRNSPFCCGSNRPFLTTYPTFLVTVTMRPRSLIIQES